MQKNQNNNKNRASLRILAFVLLFVLFCVFIIKAFPDPLSNTECLDEGSECIATKSGPQNYFFWIGVYLCSFFGLILMTVKPDRFKKGSTTYLTLGAAAAINTLMWMALVYVGAFLMNVI